MSLVSGILIFPGVILGLYILFVLVKKTLQASRGDPQFWEWEIRRFERQDQKARPPAGVIVFTGSSSINFWKTLEGDMAPLPVINRGFGGAQIHQVTYYAERIILPYRPKAVLLYAGENDIAGAKFSQKKSAADVLATFEQFCATVHAALPDIPIYFVSIKPPKLRLKDWPEMQKANQLVEAYCQTDERLHYIDVVPAMLDPDGNPRTDVFKWDGLHLNAAGYATWTSVIKPILEKDL